MRAALFGRRDWVRPLVVFSIAVLGLWGTLHEPTRTIELTHDAVSAGLIVFVDLNWEDLSPTQVDLNTKN